VTRPQWFSQPYPPDGASAAEGIRNQLGRPELDLLTILVREAAQNSWDARLENSTEPVELRLDLRRVGPAEIGNWREFLKRGAPTDAVQFPLRDALRGAELRIMEVSDRGTTGLGGPTRADLATGPERDFVSFVRNIGEPRDTALGGGTYGFGKGIFYLLSRCGAVLVHTRCCTDTGARETRLMGLSLWKSYVTDGSTGVRRYTGRHWWGDTTGKVVEPLVGDEAETTAKALGLREFGPEETGTAVVVVDPILDELEPAEAADYLADTVAWHLWPKMIRSGEGSPQMTFTVVCDGVAHPVPDPRETLPLNMFVAAYERMLGAEGKDLHCRQPKKYLGRLGLTKRILPGVEPSRASRMLDIEDLVHHVCLMRPAELVVTYHPGPKPPSKNLGYAGVFRGDIGMDDIFAKAEPPTHDAWNAQSLERPESTFVRTTFRRIEESLDNLLSLGGDIGGGTGNYALGAASSRFSRLVGGVWGIGGATDYAKPGSTVPRPQRGGDELRHDRGERGGNPEAETAGARGSTGRQGSHSSTVRRPRVQYVGEPYYDDRGEDVVLVQEFCLPVAGSQRVRADLAVTLPGVAGRETDPPLGAAMPALLGWEDARGRLHTGDQHLTEGGASVWKALVRPAPDTMTEINIKVEGVDPV
jgi:hypothetical protein